MSGFVFLQKRSRSLRDVRANELENNRDYEKEWNTHKLRLIWSNIALSDFCYRMNLTRS